MFDIGISELLLIAVVALVVVGPKDLPVVLRHVMKFVRELRSLYMGLKTQMHEVMEEAGLNDVLHNTNTIIDLEGKPQNAYNVNELHMLETPKPPTPPAAQTLGASTPASETTAAPAAEPIPTIAPHGDV